MLEFSVAGNSENIGIRSGVQRNMMAHFRVLRSRVWLIILFAGMTGPQALAQSESKIGPIYNPASKSYFELRHILDNGWRWRQVRKTVANLQFKGVQGRLAIVDSFTTHYFLMENFPLNTPAWIGLYVDCKTLNAYWVNGKQQLNNEISLWHNPWYRKSNIRCGRQRFDAMPVRLLPQRRYKNFQGNTGFRWMATGPEKGHDSVLVEYPTGGE